MAPSGIVYDDDADHLVKPYGTQSRPWRPPQALASQYGLTRQTAGCLPLKPFGRCINLLGAVGCLSTGLGNESRLSGGLHAGPGAVDSSPIESSGQIRHDLDLDLITRNQVNQLPNRVRIQSSQPYKFARSFDGFPIKLPIKPGDRNSAKAAAVDRWRSISGAPNHRR